MCLKKKKKNALEIDVSEMFLSIAVVTVVYLDDILPMFREQVNETTRWKPRRVFSPFPHTLLFKLGCFVSVPHLNVKFHSQKKKLLVWLIVAITL